ncbi:hypothetical protein BGZ94_008297 [Podila epigama]|nr:hypothetical protein BGZ94_008297 [Podila epigama]
MATPNTTTTSQGQSQSAPTINIAPYISKFVRSLHAEEDRPLEMPFNYTQFGAVLMVDIVGFSQMTNIAASKGDVGAEILSSQIGDYFDLAIRIIEYHGGDVVKFLGDALLVVFQADPEADRVLTAADSPSSEDRNTVSRRDKVTVRKAIECGLELLARLSNYRIYLSEREYSRKLSGQKGSTSISGDESPMSVGPNSPWDDGNNGNLMSMNNSQSGNSNSSWNNANANASGYGPVSSSNGSISSNSYLNVPQGRSSSSSNGAGSFDNPRRSSVPNNAVSPMSTVTKFASGTNLDSLAMTGIYGNDGHNNSNSRNSYRKREESLMSSRPGSTTSKHNRAGNFFNNAKQLFTNSNVNDRYNTIAVEDLSEDVLELQLHMAMTAGPICRLEFAICGEQMATIDDALSMARAGELTITKEAWACVVPGSYPWVEQRRQCYILKNNQQTNDDPLLRRIRNDRLFNTPVESNPHYYKYINKSAIHRLILYPDNTFPAQFRTVTILFVSLGNVKPWTPEGLETCQKAMFEVHKVTSEYEGFIQQFAVDDKGATLLCAFGLPYPRSHEREAVFAAKSAWVIRRRLLAQGIPGFKISLATGVIFTSMIGNEFRRDPAIVGDTIVIAVRILKFDYATESIVCDDATKEACTSDHDGLCEFEDMGEEFVKGKIHPIRIWRLIHFGAKKQIRKPDDIIIDEIIGYEPEREKVTQFIKAWEQEPNMNTMLITGPRGSGKSIFYQHICHIADSNGYQICTAASAEVEKNTEYYLCKFLLLGLFDIMRKKDIPYASRLDSQRDLGITLASQDKEGTDDKGHGHQRSLSNATTLNTPTAATFNTSSLPGSSPRVAITSSTLHGQFVSAPTESPTTATFGPSMRSSLVSSNAWEYPSSPTIGQSGEPSKRSSTYITKLQALISVSLQKMGEGDEMMHILHDIIAALSADNSAPELNERDDEMLADFIVRMLNYASAFVRIVTMFEDVQWTDKKSLHIIQVIHERCPGVLVVLFSRPQRDYGGNMLNSITNHQRHLEIVLDGLKKREIEGVMLKAFADNGVEKISPEVIDFVQEKTKGNPKFVKNMANMLKDFCHVNIVDGELLTTGQQSTQIPPDKNMEDMLVRQDRKKMTLMQYDRMTARFQDFLKIASCLGEKFSLAEVAAIRQLDTMLGVPEPGRTYPTMISDLDTYRFLNMSTDQQTNVHFSENVVENTLYTFGSGSTARDIYESIPYEERVQYHLRLGQFYEKFLEPANFGDLLPQVTRHYLKTEHTEKKIKYLKAISAFYLKSNMLAEATENLTDLIRLLDTERGASNMVSQEDLAEIYGMKGETLSKRMRIEEAEPALLDSLARDGIHWPKSTQQWRMALFLEKTKFALHYHGGTTPGLNFSGGRPPKAKVDAKTQVQLQRIIHVLGCLQNIYFWKTDSNAAMLSTLLTLNYSRKLGLPSGEQTVSLGRYGILNYFKGNKHVCNEYMEKARLSHEAGETTEGMLPSMRGYVNYCEGRIEQAHQDFSDAISESKTFGVVSNLATFYRSVTLKCAFRMWEGSFNRHREDSALLRAMSAVAIQNGDSEGETLFAIPTLANLLLQDRLRDAESWVVLIERFIMPKARLMNLLVIHGMLAYYYAKMGNFSKTRIYAELMAERIDQQGTAAHPFPLMSCAFTIMALYEMLDSAAQSSSSISGTTLGGGGGGGNGTHGGGGSGSGSLRGRGGFGSSSSLSRELGNGGGLKSAGSSIHRRSGTPSASSSGVAGTFSQMDAVHAAKTDLVLKPTIQCMQQDPFHAVAQTFIVLAEALRCFIAGHHREGLHRLQRGWDRLEGGLTEIRFVRALFLAKLGRHAEPGREKDGYYSQAHALFVSMDMDPSGWIVDPSPGWKPPQMDLPTGGECNIGMMLTPV